MKNIIIKQLKDNYQGILERKENGWKTEDLINYTAGISNSLFDFINDLHDNNFISDKDLEEIEEVFIDTIDKVDLSQDEKRELSC